MDQNMRIKCVGGYKNFYILLKNIEHSCGFNLLFTVFYNLHSILKFLCINLLENTCIFSSFHATQVLPAFYVRDTLCILWEQRSEVKRSIKKNFPNEVFSQHFKCVSNGVPALYVGHEFTIQLENNYNKNVSSNLYLSLNINFNS